MNEKIEDLLDISLNVSDEELTASKSLAVGVDKSKDKWEVIVRNNRPISFLEEIYEDIIVYELLGGYSIVKASKSVIKELANYSEIDYMELPKSFYYGLVDAKRESCIFGNDTNYSSSENVLNGKGTLVAIIDSGIDILNSQFIDDSGKSRIVAIWDQQEEIIYNRDEINQAIENRSQLAIDISGHGTNVAHIATGRDGVANAAEIIVVKLKSNQSTGISGVNLYSDTSYVQTASIMRAVDFVIRKSIELNMPVAINISIGSNSGAHDGSSLLETYLDYIAGTGRNVICVGTGNEAMRGIHASGVLDNISKNRIELGVGEYETSISIQLWKNFADEFDVQLITPSGISIGPYNNKGVINRYEDSNVKVITYIGEVAPYNIRQEIYLEIIASDVDSNLINDLAYNNYYIESGIWTIILIPKRIINGAFDIYLPSSAVLGRNTGFLKNSASLTLTIPSTARKVISVGAYNHNTLSYSAFSGRGAVNNQNENYYNVINKPDIVAPGVDIVLDKGMLSERTVTGTSFATPFVTGSAALLMQWGIVIGNDKYMYGEKIKAYLQKGAQKLLGYDRMPNNITGWGALCLNESLKNE